MNKKFVAHMYTRKSLTKNRGHGNFLEAEKIPIKMFTNKSDYFLYYYETYLQLFFLIRIKKILKQ